MATVAKEHEDGAPALQKYLYAHMTPLNPHMLRLREETLKDPEFIMMGASDELNFLQILVKTLDAKKTLDIGVFTGYSALAIALVLPPEGKLVACDVTDKWVNKYGRAVWKDAGVESKIDLRIAPAIESLQALVAEGQAGTFDFAFIDADKGNYLKYYEACLTLLRPGGIIAVDNALFAARVLEPESEMDERTRVIHGLNKTAAKDPRVHASLLNVGDGVLLCRKV